MKIKPKKKARPERRRRVFVAMSGGVDSSVAALLLKNQGYDVVGVFMRCFNVDGCAERDAEDARRVAQKLKIPFYVFDFEEEYKRRVVDYMVEGYRSGITPNPDVMCNKEIKFGLFFKKALTMGADYIATGHYVRLKKIKNPAFGGVFEEFQDKPNYSGLVPIKSIGDCSNLSSVSVDNFKGRGPAGSQTPETRVPTPSSDRPRPTAYSLYQAKDNNKDQSYFLWILTQEQLKYCLFPIGDYLKSKVREMARKAGLPTAEKKDSQGICFLGKVTLGEFLGNYIPEKPGKALNADGKLLGEHHGAHFYTIGQRHLGIKYQVSSIRYQVSPKHPDGSGATGQAGINGRHETPAHYVAAKDVKTNTLILAEGVENPAFYKKEIKLTDVNFVSIDHSPIRANWRMNVLARVRYRQPLAPATLNCSCELSVVSCKLEFDSPVKFVAPGQSAVFYLENGEMLGGGIII